VNFVEYGTLSRTIYELRSLLVADRLKVKRNRLPKPSPISSRDSDLISTSLCRNRRFGDSRKTFFGIWRSRSTFFSLTSNASHFKPEHRPFAGVPCFSHQELAIASYLDIEVLAFQESGVKPLDGILGFLQANAIPFTDRAELPKPNHGKKYRNESEKAFGNHSGRIYWHLDVMPTQFSDANRIQQIPGQQPASFPARFFHIDVYNRHRSKIATNCYAYLEKARNVQTCKEIAFKTVEYKWAGYILPNAIILPKQTRRLDAFWVAHTAPTKLYFNAFVDST